MRDQYWSGVTPRFVQPTEPETNELIDRLLEVDRPRAAFSIVRFDWEKVETSRLKRLLIAVATVDSEPVNSYPTVDSEPSDYKIDSYCLSEALGSLTKRPGVTRDEMAHLEFIFIGALRNSEHGEIPHLEQCIAESPLLFVQILALVYRRSDDGQDPPEWRVDDPTRRDALGAAADALLERVERMPGTDSNGQVDAEALKRWVIEARNLCKKHDRVEIGDLKIGEWLSRAAPYEDDTPWPGQPGLRDFGDDCHRGHGSGVQSRRVQPTWPYYARGIRRRRPGAGPRCHVSFLGADVEVRVSLRREYSRRYLQALREGRNPTGRKSECDETSGALTMKGTPSYAALATTNRPYPDEQVSTDL